MQAVPKTPLCPRCRYDQSGNVVRWTEECPLEGLCPECGLRFEWRDVFGEPLIPEWWIERDESRLRFRAARTLLRSLWPVSFWRRIRLEFDGRLRNSIWLLVFLLGCFYVSEAIATAAALYDLYVNTRLYAPNISVDWRSCLVPFTAGARPNMLWILFYAACFPLAATVLPQTRRRAKVAWPHLTRVFVYATSAGLIVQMTVSAIAVAIVLVDNFTKPARFGASFLTFYWSLRLSMFTALGFLPVVAFSWWYACRRYLRLDHAPAVALSLAVISVLATFTVIVSIEAIKRFGFYGTFFGP
ncbi:MAG: hypothetical protein JNK16_10565 [Phycisphaerales bacterium]|nr:hypothetical protein [Phycisphaerales bacterium]